MKAPSGMLGVNVPDWALGSDSNSSISQSCDPYWLISSFPCPALLSSAPNFKDPFAHHEDRSKNFLCIEYLSCNQTNTFVISLSLQ